jgi:DNA-binding GntR family transcriptional regulator
VYAERARSRLRQLILDGTFPAGARLTEQDAAANLAMSRTPVREALRALTADGLVRPAGRGVEVVALDRGALREAYQVRAALEALTAELAAARQRAGEIPPAGLAALRAAADAAATATAAGRLIQAMEHNRRFHQRIADLAGNALAMRTLDRIWDQIQVSTMDSLTPPTRPAHVSAQHKALLAAIRAGRPDDAGRLARQHAMDTGTALDQKG